MTQTPLIAIASGKGGVGKTWFAATAAHALAAAGRRVLLLDADVGLANIDIQLGLSPGRGLEGVLRGMYGMADAITPTNGGFDLIAGQSGAGPAGLDPLLASAVLRDLTLVAGAYDRVLIDCGAGIDPVVRRFATGSATLLVVITEEPTSLTDAYALIKLCHRDHPTQDVRVVVNQATSSAAGARAHATLARACETFLGTRPRLAGVIRRDERVRDAIRHQTLLRTRHPATQAVTDVDAIARTL